MLKKEKQKDKKIMKEQVASKLEDLTVDRNEQPDIPPDVISRSEVTKMDETHVKIENQLYEIVLDYRDAFSVEAIAERYNTILNKYDYIVGDWGYDQLRLKGFFDESNNRAPFDKKIDFLEDYLFEYCNFGCAYFVLEKEKSEKNKKTKSQRKRKAKKIESKNDKGTRVAPTPKKSEQKNQNKEFVIKKSEKEKSHSQVKNQKANPTRQERPKTDFKIHTAAEEK